MMYGYTKIVSLIDSQSPRIKLGKLFSIHLFYFSCYLYIIQHACVKKWDRTLNKLQCFRKSMADCISFISVFALYCSNQDILKT